MGQGASPLRPQQGCPCMTLEVCSPAPLAAEHQLDDFDCGEPVLNDWLKRRALANHLMGASRTFVIADPAHRVLGYYALAAGAVAHQQATGSIRRNMPDPIPVMVLARLAIDRRAQGMHLGGALLKDAVQRSFSVAHDTGVRALLVHALNDAARKFYEHYGFQASPAHPMTLMLRISVVK